jgi:O-antigen/teichoic acid export membrane protein
MTTGTDHRWLPAFGNLAAGEVVTSAFRLLAFVWVARELGPVDFGTVSVGFVVGAYLILLAHPGLELIGTRAIAREPGSATHWLGHIVGLRIALGIVAYVVMAAIVAVLPVDGDLRLIIVIVGLTILTQAVDVRWAFIGAERTRAIAVASVLGAAVYLGGVLLFVHGPEDLFVPPISYVVGQAVISVVLVVASRRHLGGWSPRFRRGSGTRALFWESTPLTVGQVGRAFAVSLDVVLVKALRPAAGAGQYAAASRLFVVGLLYLGLYYNALLPTIVRAAGEGQQALAREIRRSCTRAVLIGTPIAVAGILLAPLVIPFVLGDDYEPAAGLFQVLMVALLLVAVSGVMNNALIALGRTRTFAGIVVASLVVNVAVNLALLPTVGVVGAAIATVATEALVLVLATIAVWTGMARGARAAPDPPA